MDKAEVDFESEGITEMLTAFLHTDVYVNFPIADCDTLYGNCLDECIDLQLQMIHRIT